MLDERKLSVHGGLPSLKFVSVLLAARVAVLSCRIHVGVLMEQPICQFCYVTYNCVTANLQKAAATGSGLTLAEPLWVVIDCHSIIRACIMASCVELSHVK